MHRDVSRSDSRSRHIGSDEGCACEAAKALKRPAVSTKAQQALAAQREAMKRESAQARSLRRADEAEARFEQRKLKRKQKHRGH